MAEAEEPQFSTLAERIAALNRQKNFQAPASGAGKRAPPPPPPASRSAASINDKKALVSLDVPPSLPVRPVHSKTEKIENAPPSLPRRAATTVIPEHGDADDKASRRAALPPPLPSRNSQTSPALPPRRPSGQNGVIATRRNSNSSDVSHLSTTSSLSLLSQTASSATNGSQPLRKLPPALDQAKLPPLPPSRRELEAKAKEAAEKEAAQAARAPPLLPTRSAPVINRTTDQSRQTLPPPLPTRRARTPGPEQRRREEEEEVAPALPARRLPPPPSASNGFKSALESGFGSGSGSRSTKQANGDAPPPIPLSSRPTFAQIDAARVTPTAAIATDGNNCLICRDFSGPDTVASQHPIHTLPRQDPVGHLARVLCDPFSSHTDKARAIFTWCHHNIAYDVESFFGNCIPRGQTPSEMIFSGKGVCEGYAKIYEAVATRAGLECVVVVGHGKGYGFDPPRAGQAVPARNATGHAWNAVRIDGGAWKLLDACWGAGHLGDDRRYNQKFAPAMFHLPNELFGERHFPADARHFYRADGRVPSWEEYVFGPLRGEEPATWYNNANEEGLDPHTFAPQTKKIAVRGTGGQQAAVVRFRFARICEHWTSETHGLGKQMLFMLKVHGVDGRADDLIPLDFDNARRCWWADMPVRELGCAGQSISLIGLATLDGQSARGVTKAEFLRKKGKCGMSWVGIVAWDLV